MRLKMPNPLNFAKKLFSSDNIQSFEPLKKFEKKHKIVVFVPENNVNNVTFAMAAAGAGKIGNYTVCSFRVKGEGTFKGGKSSNPVIGKKGKFEKVEEVRLEMVCDKKNLDDAVNKMLSVHPYEEPAYEIYDIITGGKKLQANLLKIKLKNPVSLKQVLNKLNKKIDISLLLKADLKKKYSSVLIDFTGDENISYPGNGLSQTLKISGPGNGEFYISF